jgi:hypothetical protein
MFSGSMRLFESRRMLVFIAAFFIICSASVIYGAISRSELVTSPDFPSETQERNFSGSDIRFQSHNPHYTTYFMDSGLILAGFTERAEGGEYFEIRLQLHNIQEDVEITTLNPMLAENEVWLTNLPDYARIKYANIYPGIDMMCSGNKDQLQIEYIIAPGGDPRKIRFQISGADQVQTTPEGSLLLNAGKTAIEIPRPIAYQTIDASGAKFVIDSKYVLKNKQEFTLQLGAYNLKRSVIIQPSHNLLSVDAGRPEPQP